METAQWHWAERGSRPCCNWMRIVFCLLLLSSVVLSYFNCVVLFPPDDAKVQSAVAVEGGWMAVVVPVYEGDLNRALQSVQKWPSKCSASTMRRMDLILYYVGSENSTMTEVFNDNNDLGSFSCFESKKLVHIHLTEEEESVYAINPSVQLYKIFLDDEVKKHFSSYDMLTMLEWDVTVAYDTSFERLYLAAFATEESFWVKGSTLGETNFRDRTVLPESWHMVGHLSGNTIYSNNNPAFEEFISYTRDQWGYNYPFDVAMWATVSDFPYSWLLWHRYSNKFLASNLMANIGFVDAYRLAMEDSQKGDTLFVHGSSSNGADSHNNTTSKSSSAMAPSSELISIVEGECTSSCGSSHRVLPKGTSTVCDSSCSPYGGRALPRFGGYMCGARDEAMFGKSCRLCYTDLEIAQEADIALGNYSTPGKKERPNEDCHEQQHVIMCDTLAPPPAKECHFQCAAQTNAICDATCKDQRFGAFNCNFRGYGESCRSCFRDVKRAQEADTIARRQGGRAIMCDTHEPPLMQSCTKVDLKIGRVGDKVMTKQAAPKSTALEKTHRLGTIDHTELCIVLRGYHKFIPETAVTVESVLHFMKGASVAIATHPSVFFSFNRTFGGLPGVTVQNRTNVDYIQLWGDEICGNTTKLIYYIEAGTIVAREPLHKDIYSIRGELLVQWYEVEKLPQMYQKRASFSSYVFGFEVPSFTFGGDVILPKNLNAKLREALSHRAQTQTGEVTTSIKDEDLEDFLVSLRVHNFGSVDIPELLAALAFAESYPGLHFVNPVQWNSSHFLEDVSVWDVPLIKPPFSCMVDMGLASQGYDVSSKLRTLFESLKINGGGCKTGKFRLDGPSLGFRSDVEFGPPTRLPMPNIEEYDISVMYRTFYEDADFFEASLLKVMDHFPSAREVVVVVEERDEDLFKGIVKPHVEVAPFPIKVITEPSLMDGSIQQKYSKLRADIYCKGAFILHMDSDVAIMVDLTYDHIFKFGKPVLPFRRYHDDQEFGSRMMTACWKNGTSLALGEDVVHEFSLFNTHVYPRAVYPAIRNFIEDRNGMSFADFMGTRRGACMRPETLAKWTPEERDLLLSDFNLIGAYLWYHMHSLVYWIPTEPLDIMPDTVQVDVAHYSWVCQGNGRHAPKEPELRARYISGFGNVTSPKACRDFFQKKWH